MWARRLHGLENYTNRRLVVVYMSPLPAHVLFDGDHQKKDLRATQTHLLAQFTRGTSSQASSDRGVFVRLLEETAFERHLEGLGYF